MFLVPVLMVSHFLSTTPYKLFNFGKMPIFFANCTRLLTRTQWGSQEKKFEDVFLVKIANK